MPNQRASGILLHPTSFPSHGGIGDLGPAAYEFVDFLAAGPSALWQVLPLNPAGHRQLALFLHFGLCRQRSADQSRPSRRARIDFAESESRSFADAGRPRRLRARRRSEAAAAGRRRTRISAQRRWQGHAPPTMLFAATTRWWLEDFVLFDALRRRFHQEELEPLAARAGADASPMR